MGTAIATPLTAPTFADVGPDNRGFSSNPAFPGQRRFLRAVPRLRGLDSQQSFLLSGRRTVYEVK
jgi:hypothetical protein